jgi:hypothetical protein
MAYESLRMPREGYSEGGEGDNRLSEQLHNAPDGFNKTSKNPADLLTRKSCVCRLSASLLGVEAKQ